MEEQIKAGIQLKAINLVTSIFQRGDYLQQPSVDNIPMEIGTELKLRDNFLDCIVLVNIGNITDEEAFGAAVKMVGIFKKNREVPYSDDEFSQINAPAIIYPYIRQHIRALSLDAGMNPIILPLINFQKRYELIREQEEAAKLDQESIEN